jgi:signal peptidase I
MINRDKRSDISDIHLNFGAERKRNADPIFFAHIGCSMNPTLWEGDLLKVVPFDEKSVQVGDVIVFTSPIDGTLIAHRVIATSFSYIRTKGDSNGKEDPWLVRHGAVLGKVVESSHNTKNQNIHGGLNGLLLAKLSNYKHITFLKSKRFLYPIFQAIQKRNIRLNNLSMEPKVACFKGKDKKNILLISGKTVIGNYDEKYNKWYIHPIYRLFINEASLPEAENLQMIEL